MGTMTERELIIGYSLLLDRGTQQQQDAFLLKHKLHIGPIPFLRRALRRAKERAKLKAAMNGSVSTSGK